MGKIRTLVTEKNRFKELKRRGVSRTGKTKSLWRVLVQIGFAALAEKRAVFVDGA